MGFLAHCKIFSIKKDYILKIVKFLAHGKNLSIKILIENLSPQFK